MIGLPTPELRHVLPKPVPSAVWSANQLYEKLTTTAYLVHTERKDWPDAVGRGLAIQFLYAHAPNTGYVLLLK